MTQIQTGYLLFLLVIVSRELQFLQSKGKYDRRKAKVSLAAKSEVSQNVKINIINEVGSSSSPDSNNTNENEISATADSSTRTIEAEKTGIEVSTQTECSDNVEQMKITIENLSVNQCKAKEFQLFVGCRNTTFCQ